MPSRVGNADLSDVTTWYDGMVLTVLSKDLSIVGALDYAKEFLTPHLAPDTFILSLREAHAEGATYVQYIREQTVKCVWDLGMLRYHAISADYSVAKECTNLPMFFCMQKSTGEWPLKVHDLGVSGYQR